MVEAMRQRRDPCAPVMGGSPYRAVCRAVLRGGGRVWHDLRAGDLYRSGKEFELMSRAMGFAALALLTVIPLLILIIIGIPTVRTIFKTQAAARSDALQVEVVGHQWWWEFRYPQYKITTANELYLPVGRKVNFTLHSNDVIHSFSIPRLGGKRDLIANHTNFLWFTPDSIGEQALNGMCAEYCGASHANMRFKVFTVTPENFA